MATNITQYNATAGSNTSIDSINLQEGQMVASDVNNAIRSLMSHLKNVDTGTQALTALSVTGNVSVGGTFTSRGIDDNADATAITINSSETVMIGRTATGYSNTGAQFTASGAQNIFVADGDYPLGLNRQNSSGIVLDIRHEGTSVGSIQERFNNIQIGTGETNLLFNNGSNEIAPSGSSGGTRDNTTDLGANNRRWKNVWVGGGVYLGGTGSANKLDDYEEGTFTPSYSMSGGDILRTGRYTKVGNMVTIFIRGQYTQTTSSTALGRITGLPFTILNETGLTSVVFREFATTGFLFSANLDPNTTQSNELRRYDNASSFTSGQTVGIGLEFSYRVA